MVPSLPERLSGPLAVRETGPLFECCHEPPEVGGRLSPFDQNMKVIRHEAVRNDCKPFVGSSAQHLREHGVHRSTRDEDSRPLIGSGGDEVALKAQVVETWNPWWACHRLHDLDRKMATAADRHHQCDTQET